MSEGAYIIKTHNYEGPLDALATLIHKRKLLINDISLAEVTAGFISYINSLDDTPLENMSDFVDIASTLLLVKSKSLLPHLHLTYEEELSIEELKGRLAVYDELKQATAHVTDAYNKTPLPYAQVAHKQHKVFAPGNDLNRENVLGAVGSLLHTLTERKKEESIKQRARIKPLVALKHVIGDLQKRVEGSLSLSFRDITSDVSDRAYVIVNFLALLELAKDGTIDAQQERMFDDITITSNVVGVPRYM